MEDRKPEKEKTEYQKIISGEVEPIGCQKGWKNLEKRTSFNMMEPEKAREIRRKGAEAVNKLHGEKKSAKQSLEQILTIKIDDDTLNAAELPEDLKKKLKRTNPNATLYDLVQIVAVGRAVSGNIRAAEYIRDTHGDQPIKQIEISDATTDADRKLMQQLLDRMQAVDVVQVVDIEPAADPDAEKDDNT